MGVEIIGESGLKKAVTCLQCLSMTSVEMPAGSRESWTDDPLPPEWTYVIDVMPGVGACVVTRCHQHGDGGLIATPKAPIKAIICMDCLTISAAEMPEGLIRRSWDEDPLPVGWRHVASDFGILGDCARAQCGECAHLAETNMVEFHQRYARARNITFVPGDVGHPGSKA